MAPLECRLGLRVKAAEAISDPTFIALTSLAAEVDAPLESIIKHVAEELSVDIKQRDENHIAYVLTRGDKIYSGQLSLAEEDDQIVTQIDLEKVNDKKVVARQAKRGKVNVGYVENKQFVEIGNDELKTLNYWVPTIINHIAKNAELYLRAIIEANAGIVHSEDPKNIYRLDTDQALSRASPTAHFRHGFERKLDDGDDDGSEITVKVTGTYVRTNWGDYSTDQVVESITGRAKEISPDHFLTKLLDDIGRAGHDKEAVQEAYQNSR